MISKKCWKSLKQAEIFNHIIPFSADALQTMYVPWYVGEQKKAIFGFRNL